MKRFILFLLFSQISFIMCAELQNYLPGYIITLKQDTIFGQINFKTDQLNNKECHFRLNDKSDEVLYLPKDISAYRFSNNGKFYTSRKITIDGNESFVFLEYLIQGLINVYYYFSPENISYYFFEKEDGTMQMITKNAETIEDMKVVEDKRYDGTLRYIFQNYIPKEYSSSLIEYNQKTMIDIAKKYHQALCTTGEQCIVFENNKPDAQVLNFSFGIYSGINFAEYIINNMEYYQGDVYYKTINIPSINPMLGVVANLYYPRWSKSFSLLLDMSITKMDVSKKYTIENSIETQIKGYIFESKIGIKYTYPKYKIRPVAEIALGYTEFGYLIRSIYFSYSDPDSPFYEFLNQYFSLCGGVGIDYNLNKRNSIIFRISSNLNSLSPWSKVEKGRLSEYQIKLGYIF